ncbi:hypothetical protein B0H14DRAFT_2645432 [Mycena olivaceomarginata]|nr:hypothetical protein B0H14DRAFT_2645432 [Mycena olivaceomarginata]
MSIPKSRFRKIDFYAKRPGVTVDELHSTLLEGAKVVAEIPLVKTNMLRFEISISRGNSSGGKWDAVTIMEFESREKCEEISRDPEFLKVVMKLGEKDVFERWEVVLCDETTTVLG